MGLQTVEALCTYAALLESDKRKANHLVTFCTSVAHYAQFGQLSLLSLRPSAVCMSILSILNILSVLNISQTALQG